MNINEEGKYYASMVRKFRTEYKSKNLQGFCRDQKVSYNKMLHCLHNDSYRKPKTETPRFKNYFEPAGTVTCPSVPTIR